MNYIQYMQFGGKSNTIEEGTLRVNPETNRTQTYRNGEWQDNVITVPWQNGETVRTNNGQQEIYLDGKWRALKDPKWYENIKEEDWYTLGSIVGDLTGLGLGAFGLSVPAAISGMASTTSQLIGDIKRDGFQFRDAAGAAMGYGLDAATFIPGFGELAQGAKLSKKIAKYAPYILKTFGGIMSGLGMTSALPTIEKATRGEKLTMDDYRALTNGLMGIVGLKNTFSSPIPKDQNTTIQQQTSRTQQKPTTDDRLRELEDRLNERHQQIAESNPNWQFKLAQMAADTQMKDKARMLEQTGAPKSWRHRLVKKSPIGIAEPNPMLDHILLINRAGGDGQILWQNGSLVWPHRKSVIDDVQGKHNFDRPTVHFTTHKPVTDHGYGQWSGSPTTIMVPITEVMKSNGRPLSIQPMDTYWNNSVSMQVPASAVRVFTGSLAEAAKAKMQGAQVTFSKEAHKLAKRIQTLSKQWDDLERSYSYDMSKVWSDLRSNEIQTELRRLEEENYALHRQFTDQQQQEHPLTLEDYKLLESITGLQAGVTKNVSGDLSYHSTPTQHFYEWWSMGLQTGNHKDAVENYIDHMVRHLEKIPPQATQHVKETMQSEKEAWTQWAKTEGLSNAHLLALQQVVAKLKPQDLKRLKKLAEVLPDDYPNIQKLRQIANGERVYQYKLGGKMNCLQYIQGNGKSGGTIKIKKKNKGKFTASAKAAGEGVQEHAHKVMNDPNATPLQKKRANFAIQAKKWHRKHQLGGKINYLDIFA